MAKFFACETAVQVAIQGQQILGGIGYTKEYPVERFVRDSRLLPIGDGTSEIIDLRSNFVGISSITLAE